MTSELDLYDTLSFDFDSFKDKNYLTHNYHPYPAKYVPQIPKEIILRLSKKGDLVLDPFCGSGTTLVECLVNSRNAIGNDLNPIATLVSKVKTTVLSEAQIRQCIHIARAINSEISLLYGESTIVGDKDWEFATRYTIPSFYHIDFWFKPHVQKELTIILNNIERNAEGSIKDFLLVAFSAILTGVSNMESETRYASVDKNIGKKETFARFLRKVEDMSNRMNELRSIVKDSVTSVHVHDQDSTNLSFVEQGSIDLVVTSPPYPNTYDYYLYHRNRMYWLGMDPKRIQLLEIGSRNKHSDDDLGIEGYLDPMSRWMQEIHRVLKPNKHLAVVIGDAIIMNQYVKMDLEYEKMADQQGLQLVKKVSYPLRNYTTAFTRGYKKGEKMGHILVFKSA